MKNFAQVVPPLVLPLIPATKDHVKVDFLVNPKEIAVVDKNHMKQFMRTIVLARSHCVVLDFQFVFDCYSQARIEETHLRSAH